MSVPLRQLVIRIAGNIDQTVTLTNPVTTIGRTPDNDISLPNPIISRRHAEIRIGPDGVTLIDLGSDFGTYLNDQPIPAEQPYRLTPGTEFVIGPYVLTYREVAAGESAEVVASEDTDGFEAPETVVESPAVAQAARVPIALRPPRENEPVPPPPTNASSYIQMLPAPFQENDFLQRFLLIFETIWEPLEQRQDAIEMYFDPKTCPVSFLPWLASWIDMPLDDLWTEDRLRRVLGEATELYRWQGTRYGLERMLEVQAGVHARVIEHADQPYVVEIAISIPEGNPVDLDDIREIIETHKPAHVGYMLNVESS